jgi:hypothetical protein
MRGDYLPSCFRSASAKATASRGPRAVMTRPSTTTGSRRSSTQKPPFSS